MASSGGGGIARLPSRLRRGRQRPVSTSAADEESCAGFLPWFRRFVGAEISSVLDVGSSAFGRSLIASKPILAGDCILQVPYSAYMTIDELRVHNVPVPVQYIDEVAQAALVLLAEQKLGRESRWATYTDCLPSVGKMHNTIFWSQDELQMIQPSMVFRDTCNLKLHIEKEFLAIKQILQSFRHPLDNIKLDSFMHAYALVSSRAWKTSKGVSLIPFVDFLNHNEGSDSVLLCDDYKEVSEVFSDRNYSVGEQVLIRYGKFSNATLLLDFGFTIRSNNYDEVSVGFDVPLHDPLHDMKIDLWRLHGQPALSKTSNRDETYNFIIKEIKSAGGKGIPQSLRAFARLLSATSPEELQEMACEAAEHDGRLARRPLRNKQREILAHQMLLTKIEKQIQEHHAALNALALLHDPVAGCRRLSVRRKSAADLLSGEARVLKSAHQWLQKFVQGLNLSAK